MAYTAQTTQMPYDGIIKLLEDLRKCGIQTAVVSNKADFAVQELCSQYFPKAFVLSLESEKASEENLARTAFLKF